MATKRKRLDKWAYTFRRAGLFSGTRTFTFADESEGDRYAAQLDALLDRGIVPDEIRGNVTHRGDLRSHVRAYLAGQHVSADDRKCVLILLQRLPAALNLAGVNFSWAQAWVSRMKREENLAPGTIRHHVGAMARALDWIASHGHIPANPLRLLPRGYATYTPDDAQAFADGGGRVKVDAERDRRLVGDEETRIRVVLAGGVKPEGKERALALHDAAALRLLFGLALETAMRLREMYTLTADQVRLPDRTVYLDKTKNGDKRQVPLSSVAVKMLAAYPLPKSGQIFPWWNGSTARRELDRTTARLSRQFARIFDHAGCADLHFHDLRHEATSRLFERTNLSDAEIAKITGHKSQRVLLRYANLRGSDLAAKLW